MNTRKLVFVVWLVLLSLNTKPLLGAGVDATNCTFRSVGAVVTNGVNTIKLKIEYPSVWTSWKMQVSTSLIGGNFRNFVPGEIYTIELSPYGELPKYKIYYIRSVPGAEFCKTQNTTVIAAIEAFIFGAPLDDESIALQVAQLHNYWELYKK